jgi:hypothetical protein
MVGNLNLSAMALWLESKIYTEEEFFSKEERSPSSDAPPL